MIMKERRQNTVRFSLLFILIYTIASPPCVSSSTTNRNSYNVYNYDQTTPQFTPDGRLLQVEYASSAADLSPPLIVLECFSPTNDNNSNNQNDSLSYPCTILITVPKQARSPQNRIAIIEEKDDEQLNAYSRGGTTNANANANTFPRRRSYCVAMSGILSDSLALLQAGMKVAAQHSLQYQTSLGMESLTQALADECQSRVFAGGLRPYGSTLLLCGYDRIDDNQILLEEDGANGNDNGNSNGNSNSNYRRSAFQSLIYQTDPSGGILQHHARNSEDEEPSTARIPKRKKSRRHEVSTNNNNNNNNAIRSQVRCIVGGSPTLQRQLHKRINQGMIEFEQQQQQQCNRQESSSLAGRIANVAKILIKETMDIDSSSKSRNSNDDGLPSSSSSSMYPLEVVVVSPRLGCHRLDDKQIRAIQELINDHKQAK